MQLSNDELVARLRQAVEEAGSLRRFAKQVDISPSYVGNVLLGRIPVSDRLASTLGYEMKTVYEPRSQRRRTG